METFSRALEVRPHEPLAQSEFRSAFSTKSSDEDREINDKIMKPTEVLLKRVARHALNTKQVNKGFYKGTGSGSMGSHTKYGGYKIDWDKVRTYVVPKDLKDFKVNNQLNDHIGRDMS